LIILADENIDRPVIDFLREAGFTVLAVQEMRPGISDDEVFREAQLNAAVLLTSDKDFGEMVFRRNLVSGGVILLRLAGLAHLTKGEKLMRVIREHREDVRGNFTVITPGAVRIRRRLFSEGAENA